MRRLTIYSFAILLTAVSQLDAAGVQWRNSFLDALNESVKTKKHMIVQVTAEWCTYCKKMEATTLADPEIATIINSSFVPVKVDADTQKTLVQRIKVEYVPSTVIISGDRKILAKLPGFQNIQKLKTQLVKFRPQGDSIVQTPRPQQQLIANSRPHPSIKAPVQATAPNTELPVRTASSNPFDEIQRPASAPEPNPKVTATPRQSTGDWWNQPVIAAKPQPSNTTSRPAAQPTVQPVKQDLPPSLITRKNNVVATQPAPVVQPVAKPTAPTVKQTSGQSASTFVRPKFSFGKACLCSLLDEQTMVMGSTQFTTEYKGARLCFASADHLQRFKNSPKRYWPAWGGVCAVSLRDEGKLVEGSPSFGAVYQDRLWFFVSQQKKARFTSDPRAFLPRR